MIETSQHNIRNDLGFKNNGQLNDSMFNQLWLKKFNESKWWVSNQFQRQVGEETLRESNGKHVVERRVSNSQSSAPAQVFDTRRSSITTSANFAVNKSSAQTLAPSNAIHLYKMDGVAVGSQQISQRSDGSAYRFINFNRAELQVSPIYKYMIIKAQNDVAVKIHDIGETKVLTISTVKLIHINDAYINQVRAILDESRVNINKVVVNGKVVSKAEERVETSFATDNVLDKRY